MSEIAETMLDHPLFRGFRATQVELLAECASSMRFPAGSHMFHEGETADRLYLIQDGIVTVELQMSGRDPLAIMTVGAGSVVGLSWLFPPNRWHFSARVRGDTSVVALDTGCLSMKCVQDYQTGYELMCRCIHIIGERLQATRAQLLSVSCELD